MFQSRHFDCPAFEIQRSQKLRARTFIETGNVSHSVMRSRSFILDLLKRRRRKIGRNYKAFKPL